MPIYSNNTSGALLIDTGVSCTGKTQVAKVAARIADASGVQTTVIGTGGPFRLTSMMLHASRLAEQVQALNTQNDEVGIAGIILPIINLVNWSTDEGALSLSYAGITIDSRDEKPMMADKVSRLIPCFSGVDQVRFGLFDPEIGLIGNLIRRALAGGHLTVVDTRFAPGEVTHELLASLYSMGKLGIAEVIPSDDNAWRRLAVHRAMLLHGPSVTEAQIDDVMANIKARTARDTASGVCFPREYVLANFAGAYAQVINYADGVEKLTESVSNTIGSLVTSLISNQEKRIAA